MQQSLKQQFPHKQSTLSYNAQIFFKNYGPNKHILRVAL